MDMIKIYALMSGQLVLYVGKTTQILKVRERNHRLGNGTSSKNIPYYIDWTMKLLEEVPDDQGVTKEQYYYDILKPLYNRCRPGQSVKEYQSTDAFKQSLKKYREKNDMTAYHRQWRLRKRAEHNQS